MNTFLGHGSYVYGVCLSPDAKLVFSASSDRSCRMWEVTQSETTQVLKSATFWKSVGFLDDCVVDVTDIHQCGEIEVASTTCIRTFLGHSSWVRKCCISKDVEHLFSSSGDKTVKMWKAQTGECIRTFEGHTGAVYRICLSNSNGQQWLFSGSGDKTVKIWNVITGACVATLHAHTEWIGGLCITNDDSRLFTASRDQTVKMWCNNYQFSLGSLSFSKIK